MDVGFFSGESSRETKHVYKPNEVSDFALFFFFLPSIRDIATSAFLVDRSCKSRWNANETGFNLRRQQREIERVALASSRTKQMSKRANAVMNSTFRRKRPRLTERKLPKRMEILVESHNSWIFREVGSQTLPQSMSCFEYTDANIACRCILAFVTVLSWKLIVFAFCYSFVTQ